MVSILDYEGVKSSFTAGVSSGQTVLDGIRATLISSNVTGTFASATRTTSGYSRRVLETDEAAELRRFYAPELAPRIAGNAAGGLSVNLNAMLNAGRGRHSEFLIPKATLDLAIQYSDLVRYLNQQPIPSGASTFRSILNCSNEADNNIQNILTKYFSNSRFLAHSRRFASVVDAGGQMGLRGTSIRPFPVFQGVLDEVAPMNAAKPLINKDCQNRAATFVSETCCISRALQRWREWARRWTSRRTASTGRCSQVDILRRRRRSEPTTKELQTTELVGIGKPKCTKEQGDKRGWNIDDPYGVPGESRATAG